MIPEETKTALTKELEDKSIFFTPSIEIRIDRLIDIPLMELETNNHDGIYNKVRLALKPIVNYGWDNNILRITNIYGDEFSIHVYLGKNKGIISGWEITIWDYKGTKTVGVWYKTYAADDDKLNINEIRSIKTRLEEFTLHILHCSDCQTTMPSDRGIAFNPEYHKEYYGGQYFAGHYCKKCWEVKWRAIESRENYD